MYNVISPRKYTDANGTEKTTFVVIGIGFPMKGGKDGMRIQLNALPITDTLLIMPREKKGQGGSTDEESI